MSTLIPVVDITRYAMRFPYGIQMDLYGALPIIAIQLYED